MNRIAKMKNRKMSLLPTTVRDYTQSLRLFDYFQMEKNLRKGKRTDN